MSLGIGVLAKTYDTELSIETKTTLGALANKIVNHHQGEKMMTILIIQMLNKINSLINSEKDSIYYDKSWMGELEKKRDFYQEIKTLIEKSTN